MTLNPNTLARIATAVPIRPETNTHLLKDCTTDSISIYQNIFIKLIFHITCSILAFFKQFVVNSLVSAFAKSQRESKLQQVKSVNFNIEKQCFNMLEIFYATAISTLDTGHS